MNIKGFTDRVLFALSVPKCVCCKARLNYGEKALCLKCSAVFEEFKSRNCARCARVLHKCDCSTSYLRGHFVGRVIKCFRYLDRENATPGNSLIYSLKRENRSDVLDRCADELCAAIKSSIPDPKKYIFTNVPRRRAAIIQYGMDHSALLAKEVARRLGGEYKELLGSRAKRPQKSLERTERLKNADFYIRSNTDLVGRDVIIIDDIITSGASCAMSASLIRSMGAGKIIAATLAIAYKDE